MADETETHKLQPDPPEGDRKTIERELARQEGKDPDKADRKDDRKG